MRMLLAAVLLSAAASPALADPPEEARSALSACLAAVIDKAPVETVRGQDVDITRDGGFGPCAVQVRAGDPAEIRAAFLKAVQARREGFVPAVTKWDPGHLAAQDTFCNAMPARRALNVVTTISKPGAEGLVATATVLEPPKRDPRCDSDLGLQPPPPA